jgi:hypothetical protein
MDNEKIRINSQHKLKITLHNELTAPSTATFLSKSFLLPQKLKKTNPELTQICTKVKGTEQEMFL